MQANLGVRQFIITCGMELKKSGKNYTLQNLIEWDSRSHVEKFDLRKRMTSIIFDLLIVVSGLGMLTLMFYN